MVLHHGVEPRNVFCIAEYIPHSTGLDSLEDMMVVIGSDAARRHGFGALSYELVESCRDTDLRRVALFRLKEMEGR